MSVAALSSAGFTQYIDAASNVSASQQALQSLQQSLAAGNLTAAQIAFNAYQQLNQAVSNATGNTSTSASGSQFTNDLNALGTAISSGNLSTAQSAFATFQSDLQASPAQSITNAVSAATQTVQWIDDLLNLTESNNDSSDTLTDPTTSILDSVYGLNTSSNSTDPTTSILDSVYGTNGTGNTASGTPSAGPTIPGSGNAGSGASVNAYA
jgi:hypothetical protein